jgi:LPXTG-site transpeptidase (sortase) family protein
MAHMSRSARRFVRRVGSMVAAMPRQRWLERVVLGAGVVCIAWAGVAWGRGAVYQVYARFTMSDAAETGAPGRLAEGSIVGVLEAPRIGLSVVVLEGESDRTLSLGAGHLSDTPPPWRDGNTAVAGHRDTFFRPLRRLREGDALRLETGRGTFHYRVRQISIVDSTDVDVLAPVGGVRLTLITCYPFGYVGAAPRRLIVHADARPPDAARDDGRPPAP